MEQRRQASAPPVQRVLRLDFSVSEDVLAVVDNPELINPPVHQPRGERSHDEQQAHDGNLR